MTLAVHCRALRPSHPAHLTPTVGPRRTPCSDLAHRGRTALTEPRQAKAGPEEKVPPPGRGSQHEKSGTHASRAWQDRRRGPARPGTPGNDAEATHTAPTARLVARLLVLEDPGG